MSHLFCHPHIFVIFYSLPVLFVVSFSFFSSLYHSSSLGHSVVTSSLSFFSFLSPALMLTSSAVLRPLHEANAHSGLAVAACMRSTGGPIKRRQEQEMERETGSARPQGPRRYHHCPPLCVRSGACLQTTSDPLPPPPHLVCVLGSSCPQTRLRTPLCVSSGCWLSNKNTSKPSCVCLQLWLHKIPEPLFFFFFCKPPEHCTLTSRCMCVSCV